jgi:hypothetical protein
VILFVVPEEQHTIRQLSAYGDVAHMTTLNFMSNSTSVLKSANPPDVFLECNIKND